VLREVSFKAEWFKFHLGIPSAADKALFRRRGFLALPPEAASVANSEFLVLDNIAIGHLEISYALL